MSGLPLGVPTSDAELDRRAVSRDLWPLGTLDAWQAVGQTSAAAQGPARVFWPRTPDEVNDVLRYAAREGIPVVPYGAGSGVCGGAAGSPGALTLDLKRLHRIGPLDEDRWTVDVEAGVNGQQLEDWLTARGFTLGHSPSSIGCSTVGGWAAARSAGQFSSRYGVFEDMVLRLEGVAVGLGPFAVGEGGDAPESWMDLLLGSEGTLAVFTRFRLRVMRVPEIRVFSAWRYDSVEAALEAMRNLMQGELWPSAVRLYDAVDTLVGGRTKPKNEMRSGGGFMRRWLNAVDRMPAVRRRTLALPLALPRLVNVIANRLANGVLLIVGWEGKPDVVRIQADAGRKILAMGGTDLGTGPGERWFESRHHVSYKLMPVFERGGFADTMEVATTWSGMAPLYQAVRAAVSRHVVVMAHMSHVYPEGGCIYFSFAGKGDRNVYLRTWEAAQEAVLASGGTVSHHHGIGQLKASSASREAGAALAAWKEIKAQLDPQGVMNPGRLYASPSVAVPVPRPPLLVTDGLGPAGGDDAMWDWERAGADTRSGRNAWQTGCVGVDGFVDGRRAILGRAPRSAAGVDARGWLVARDPDATTWVAIAPPGPRWMGCVVHSHPWQLARDLLRSDFRPGSWGVVGGRLYVGFRGPAALALGDLLRTSWGFEETAWRRFRLATGPLVPTTSASKAAVTATVQGVYRRAR